jgi:hypothetical protein
VNTVVWNPPQNFNDPRIWWVSVEDLDGDGALDLAVASHDAWVASPSVRLDGVLVFFGIGDGTFRNRVTYSVGPHPRSLAVADVDLDGALDLVLGGHDVSVLLGTGDGTFAGLSNFGGAIESVLSVAVANLNADDAPDIVVGDNSGAWVFLNNGDGTFAGQVSYGTGGSSVAIADLNADGVPDLALSGGGVAVLLGNGDGTFADEEIYGTGLWSVVIADLNSDDAPDLAVGNIAGVLVLLGNGDGTFADEVAYAAGHSGTHLAIADFNNDGALDLAVASAAHDAVSVLLGSGDGTFFMDMSYAAGDGPRALASTDFNRDGNADLAVAYSTGSASGDVLVFLGNGDGSLAEPVAYGGAGLEPFAVAIADFNGDNGPDLAIANSSTNNLHVVLSTCPCGNGLIDPGEECDGDPCCNVGCTFKTVSTAPCSDGDQDFDGIRDDNCAFWQCIDGVCLEAATVFADIGGSNGNCIPDGAADGNDRFHALNCFANQSTLGTAGYPCELSPPAALHADAGGPFGACCPDGVCDGNDAFHALHGFAGDSPCQCPANFVCPCPVPSAGVCLGNKLQACTSDRDCGGGSCQLVLCQPGPAPISPGEGGPQIVAAATLRLESSQDKIRAGETVDVVVTLGNALADLRGYQLHVVAVGGDAGSLDLVDLSIEARKDHVFAGLPDWRAFNVSTQQVLAGIDASGVEAPQGAYLATLVFRASEDAAGTFTIDLLHDDSQPAQRTFLFPTPAGAKIQVQETSPAVVTVQALRSRTSRTP